MPRWTSGTSAVTTTAAGSGSKITLCTTTSSSIRVAPAPAFVAANTAYASTSAAAT